VSITADALDMLAGDPPRYPHVPGDFRRHPETGAPYVNHPTDTTKDGRPRRVMYGRPSSFGSALDNPFNLIRWKERKLIEGIARQEQAGGVDLLNLDDRGEVDGFIAYAYDVAETSLAADRGTHVHLLCEWCDRGRDWTELYEAGEALGIPEALQTQIVDQWRQFRFRLGLTAVAVEQTVVNDRWRLAGTLDRLDVSDRDHLTAFGVLEAGVPFVGDIKGLALDTPLPTPTGWTTIAAVEVGDHVIGSLGEPCTVVGKSEIRQRPCYRIQFDDGSTVVADDEHRWLVASGEITQRDQVRTTRELAASVHGPYGQRQHRIYNTFPLNLRVQVDLTIDPYVLGVWLGDGAARGGSITKPPDNDIWNQLEMRGCEFGKLQIDKRTGCRTSNIQGLTTRLRAMGLLGNKHVPDAYLRGSILQRVELLRGLMDSDGTWNKRRHSASFTSTDKGLASAVYELVVSLGERASMHEVERSGFGVTVTAHDVNWTPSRFMPFAEQGKRERAQLRDTGRNRRRLIVSVDEVPSVPTQCIAVDSSDHTYLCTESMIPTHNTGGLTVGNDGQPNYWVKYPVQLAAYVDAVPYDTETDERGEW
jgi:hypothetical protein